MHEVKTVRLSRDVPAVRIPIGEETILPAGGEVDITQSLGGSYTVHAGGGLYRIAARDADALGLAPEASAALQSESAPEGPLEEKTVWDVLKSCFDPEIPVNIVDLGLVYDLAIEPLPSGKSKVAVKMTLTAPGCGMGTVIAADAQQKLMDLPGVEEAQVDIVWDPPWHHSMISVEGKRRLGIE